MGVIYLVGGIPTSLKNMSSSVGVIIANIWKFIKLMFQTTNQANGCYIWIFENAEKTLRNDPPMVDTQG